MNHCFIFFFFDQRQLVARCLVTVKYEILCRTLRCFETLTFWEQKS